MRPSLRLERELMRDGATVVGGMDEVGRGAIAGPVSVGVAVIDARTRTAPTGLRDSKLLSPAQRESLFPRVGRWAPRHAVGHCGPDEIDRWGLTAALRLAALRALAQVGPLDALILDGSHDWLTQAAPTLFDIVPWPPAAIPKVRTVIKGDQRCSSVAAASVLAKVTRDRRMTELAGEADRYGWAVNKGYTTPEHADAIRRHGLCEQHRRSWGIAAAAPVDLTAHKAGPPVVIPS